MSNTEDNSHSIARTFRSGPETGADEQLSSAPCHHAGVADDVAAEPLGRRLGAARERLGLSVQEVAERLRLRSRIITAIEAGDTGGLGAPIYVRGYLISYARLVDLPLVAVDHHLATRTPAAPPLVVTTRRSNLRWLADRYARRAGHVLLTAAIVVPVVLLATYDQLPSQRAALTPLEPGAGAAVDDRSLDDVTAGRGRTVEQMGPPAPGDGQRTPVMASIAPFYRGSDDSQDDAQDGVASAPPASVPVAAGEAGVAPAAEAGSPAMPDPGSRSGFRLIVRDASWVEVLADDGSQLAYGLLQPGTERSFSADRVAQVALGNADGVEIRLNGEPLDLAPYRRANVARFRLEDSRPVPSGG